MCSRRGASLVMVRLLRLIRLALLRLRCIVLRIPLWVLLLVRVGLLSALSCVRLRLV